MKRKPRKPGIPLSTLLDSPGFLTPPDGKSPYYETMYDELRRESGQEPLLSAIQAEIAARIAKGGMNEMRGRKLAVEGTQKRTLYSDADKQYWQLIAQGDDLRDKSKNCKAGIIARRLNLPKSAIETIRKTIR